MAYNKARAEKEWLRWKEVEEKKLRELGVDEETIQRLHTYDWAEFNRERRYLQRQVEWSPYVDLVSAQDLELPVEDVESLMDSIEDMELLRILSKEDKLTSLQEYVDRMPESQEKIYYVCADSVEHAAKMPQAERVLKAGYEVLYLTVDEDEIVLQMLENAGGKPFVSVADENALPVTEEEKANVEQAEKDHKDVLDFAQETLKDQVAKVRLSKILQSGSVCLTAEGPVSLEMEKYFRKMRRDFPMQAQKVLEINPDSSAFQALCNAFQAGDKEKAAAYVEILYNQALIIADFPLPDPARYAELVCGLMQ